MKFILSSLRHQTPAQESVLQNSNDERIHFFRQMRGANLPDMDPKLDMSIESGGNDTMSDA